MLGLLAAAVVWLFVHLVIAGTRLRDPIVARLGANGYRVAFSLASLASIIWLIGAYNDHAGQGLLWDTPAWSRWLAVFVMPVAFWLVLAGLTTPNPTSVGQEGLIQKGGIARGILRVTRHPFLWGVALWAMVHLVANGDLASVIFFGTWVVTALLGTFAIDRKRARSGGEAWQRFAAETSNLPLAALATGRNRFGVDIFGWWRLGLAILFYLGFLHAHPLLFGVAPIG